MKVVDNLPTSCGEIELQLIKLDQSVLEKKLLPLPAKERNKYTYDSLRPIIWNVE